MIWYHKTRAQKAPAAYEVRKITQIGPKEVLLQIIPHDISKCRRHRPLLFLAKSDMIWDTTGARFTIFHKNYD